MKTVSVPWGVWYRERTIELDFPDRWDVHVAKTQTEETLDARAMARHLASPIGTPLLRELARERHNAVIAIDDITRPTPTATLLPLVLRELEKGRLPLERATVIVASGAHRPAVLTDLDRKLGHRLARSLEVHVHNPYEGLIHLGRTHTGVPIDINSVFMNGDLKIAIGGITPHESVGFGGGRKTVAIGLAGLETIQAFHARDDQVRTGQIAGNAQHSTLVEIARRAGLEFIVNAVFTMNRGVGGLVAGHPVLAHEAGMAIARRAYRTAVPAGADVVVLNAYPKDTDLLQSCMALNVAWLPCPAIVRPGGSIIITTACPEGAGLHFLVGDGMRSPLAWSEELLDGYHVGIVSPNLSPHDVYRHFPRAVALYAGWPDALAALIKQHGEIARAVVYPCAALQLTEAQRCIGVS